MITVTASGTVTLARPAWGRTVRGDCQSRPVLVLIKGSSTLGYVWVPGYSPDAVGLGHPAVPVPLAVAGASAAGCQCHWHPGWQSVAVTAGPRPEVAGDLPVAFPSLRLGRRRRSGPGDEAGAPA